MVSSGGSGGASGPAFPGLGGDGKILDQTIKFGPKEEMNQPLLNLNGTFVTSESGVKHICQYSRQRPVGIDVEFRVEIKGERKSPGSSIIISIDSSDVQLNIESKLVRCR